MQSEMTQPEKYNSILANVERYVKLTEDEKQQFISILKPTRIKKDNS